MDHPAHADAVDHLRRVDAVLGQLIDRVAQVTPAPRTDGTHLGAIARAIVFQQLSGRAASTIHGRFEALYGGQAPTAEQLLATPDEQLRAVGLSRAKARYLKDLAHRTVTGALPVDRLHELDDAALLEALIDVKGVGRWTAQMFLMSRLGRPNVLPELDLGVRKAIQQAYRLRRLPTPREVLARGTTWAPYASFAAWYLWRSLDVPSVTVATPGPSRRSSTRAASKRAAMKRAAMKRAATKRTATKRASATRAAATETKRSRKTRSASPATARRAPTLSSNGQRVKKRATPKRPRGVRKSERRP